MLFQDISGEKFGRKEKGPIRDGGSNLFGSGSSGHGNRNIIHVGSKEIHM